MDRKADKSKFCGGELVKSRRLIGIKSNLCCVRICFLVKNSEKNSNKYPVLEGVEEVIKNRERTEYLANTPESMLHRELLRIRRG